MRIILSCLLRLGMTAVALLYAFLLSLPPPCLAKDTLKIGENLTHSKGASLISVGGRFELGFFSPSRSSNDSYLGIWFYKKDPKTIVWVANRDNPIPDSTGNFQISEDGNLTVLDTNGIRYWSYRTEQVSSLANLTVKLMDSGNLILGDDRLPVPYWQSFEHPTDTFLPGMKMDKDLFLTSWTASDDPGSGNFTFAVGKTGDNLYAIYRNQTQVYWADETLSDFSSEGMLSGINSLLENFTAESHNITGSSRRSDYFNTRLVMNSTGEIHLLKWDDFAAGQWLSEWHEPVDQCNIYNICGNFRSCNIKNKQFVCKCLPGFISESPEENQIQSSVPGEVYKGCFRKTTSCEENTTTFIDLKKVKVRNPDKQVNTANETECRSECLKKCIRCTAYSYDASRHVDRSRFTCFMWTSVLPTLQESPDRGLNLSVLVNKPDIGTS